MILNFIVKAIITCNIFLGLHFWTFFFLFVMFLLDFHAEFVKKLLFEFLMSSNIKFIGNAGY